MTDSEQKTVFITGATDGIGLSLARLYHQRGCRLLLTGRRPLESLNEPFFSPDTYCQADLGGNGFRQTILQFFLRQDIRNLDLCIHNAETSYYGSTAEQSPANIRQVVAVNLRAPIHLSRELCLRICEANGKLVFIGSIASYRPCPWFAVYSASKAALNGFARSLRVETEGRIRVQVIHPGASKTGIYEKVGIMQDQLSVNRFPSADRVAARILRMIESDRREGVVGRRNALLAWLGRHFRIHLETIMRRKAT